MTAERESLLSKFGSSCLFVLLFFCFIVGLSVVTAALSQIGEGEGGIIESS